MTIPLSRLIMAAFESVPRRLRLEEIAQGVIPESEIDFSSNDLPEAWKRFDVEGRHLLIWRRLTPAMRKSVGTSFRNIDPDASVSEVSAKLYSCLLAECPSGVVPALPPVAAKPSRVFAAPTSSPQRDAFPKAWLGADSSGEMQAYWTEFSDAQRSQVKKLVRATVHRTGAEVGDALINCFKVVLGKLAQPSPGSSKSSPDVILSGSSSPDMSPSAATPLARKRTRRILEVMNVRVEKRSQSGESNRRVYIQVKISSAGESDWVDASKLLRPDIVDLLRSAVIRLR